MYEFLGYFIIAITGIIFDRLMGHQKTRDRKNFPDGIEDYFRTPLLILAFCGISILVTYAGDDPTIEQTTFLHIAALLFVSRRFLFESWYYGFK